ncbi:hypothetical protein BDN70DRAFT_930192 [Pholiota conissans]|uniref:cAMP-independent regulatory protein pac2 n=1 Tax=Pholiota conissans TaxID=109636 RepID=A0A9P5Z7F1_9AGAR|nr:hypothetical protein BDN70DRAFT_930192 [Pholiota conissans]
MQQPTCVNIRIRSTNDAHRIFAAIQKGVLHMVTRRLDADERLALRSGCIYAWEERGPHSELTGLGIERFTEGRRWSPSRVRDEFLFYYEKYAPPPDANHTVIGINADRQLQPPRDWDPLVKQTYSVWVQTEKGRRKWHLTAYFTQTTIDQLGTIDDNPQIRDIVVEEGMFKSTRVGKSRSKTDDSNRSDAAKPSTSVSRTYAPFPTPYQYQQNETGSATPVLMHEPYQSRPLDQSPPSPYEQTPSPISSSPVVPYRLSHGSSYSGASPTQSHYIPTGFSIGSSSMSHSMNASSSGAHSADASPNPGAQMSALHGGHAHGPNYFSGGTVSPPPWNGNHAFGSRPADSFPSHRQHHQPHNSPSMMHTNLRASSFPSSSSYRSSANASPHPYATSLPSSHNGSHHVFPASYSLHSALVLPHAEGSTVSTDTRALQLSPLHIPDRIQQGGGMTSASMANNNSEATGLATTTPGDSDVPMDAPAGDDHDDGGLLARLPLLRPPVVKYVRDPQDEKILRRLRDGNGSS